MDLAYFSLRICRWFRGGAGGGSAGGDWWWGGAGDVVVPARLWRGGEVEDDNLI